MRKTLQPPWTTAAYLATPVATLSGMPDVTGSSGNISVDPLFVDVVGSDYHLLPASGCIDAAGVVGLAIDLDARPRPRDADGDGVAQADMGCYESPNRYVTLAGAKTLPDGSDVGVGPHTVSAVFADRYYIQDRNKAVGIGVWGTGVTLGETVWVEGSVETFEGERFIVPDPIEP